MLRLILHAAARSTDLAAVFSPTSPYPHDDDPDWQRGKWQHPDDNVNRTKMLYHETVEH
jgi:hypothetical protein